MERFLEELAKATPAPASGAASCYVGAEAAALLEMVAGFALQKGHDSAGPLVQKGLGLRQAFVVQAERDADAYTEVIAAYRLPKNAPGRGDAIARALRTATLSPLAVLDLTIELIETLREVEGFCPKTMRSDWESAVVFCAAVEKVSALNAAANLAGAANASELERTLKEKIALLGQITPQV